MYNEDYIIPQVEEAGEGFAAWLILVIILTCMMTLVIKLRRHREKNRELREEEEHRRMYRNSAMPNGNINANSLLSDQYVPD